MAGKVQRNIDGSLELRGLALEPSAGGPFDISPGISRTLANLVALDGPFSRLLTCDSSGRLAVADSTLNTQVLSFKSTFLTNLEAGADKVIATFGDVLNDGIFWHNMHTTPDMLSDILAILTDVWDPCAHTLKVEFVS